MRIDQITSHGVATCGISAGGTRPTARVPGPDASPEWSSPEGRATALLDPPATSQQPTCDACEHGTDEHSAIDRRYCDATVSSALTRGCICRLGARASTHR